MRVGFVLRSAEIKPLVPKICARRYISKNIFECISTPPPIPQCTFVFGFFFAHKNTHPGWHILHVCFGNKHIFMYVCMLLEQTHTCVCTFPAQTYIYGWMHVSGTNMYVRRHVFGTNIYIVWMHVFGTNLYMDVCFDTTSVWPHMSRSGEHIHSHIIITWSVWQIHLIVWHSSIVACVLPSLLAHLLTYLLACVSYFTSCTCPHNYLLAFVFFLSLTYPGWQGIGTTCMHAHSFMHIHTCTRIRSFVHAGSCTRSYLHTTQTHTRTGTAIPRRSHHIPSALWS